jgi:sugar/nucleoside kinase (ribokinase family)
MTLIDLEQADRLSDEMPNQVTSAGGSAANTAAVIAMMGGRTGYIGRVRDDELGSAFASGLREQGVEFDTMPASDGPSTGRSLILVTPDAQRTMNTYLGAASELHPSDVKDSLMQDAAILYLEGYLWDQPDAKDAIRKAIHLATEHRMRISLTLSDGFCVEAHRSEFIELVDGHVDILFANEAEAMMLTNTRSGSEAALALQGRCSIVAVTLGEDGSLLCTAEEIVTIEAAPVASVLDTTGAGDCYAAGVLLGLARGLPLSVCGAAGSQAAAAALGAVGARPRGAAAGTLSDVLPN